MTRIYLLGEIDQEDISSSHLIPAEDSAGNETVQMTLRQLGRYLFCAAGNEGEGGLFESQNLLIGNATFCSGNYCSAVGHSNVASDGGEGNTYASAFGYDNEASGNWGSSAFGYRNIASYSQSSAFGHKNTANDRHASAFGSDNLASGESSLAVGYNNTATDYGATAVGYNNDADNYAATAVGYNNDAEGGESSAIGHGNDAQGGESNAFGWNNNVTGGESSAFGCNNSTNSGAYRSLALGYGCQTTGDRSTAIGYQAVSRWDDTINFGGAIVVRGYNGEESDASVNFSQFSGVQNVVMTPNIDFTTISTVTLNVPTGCRFYVDEISIIVSEAVSVGDQPFVMFGFDEDSNGFLASVATTNLLTAGSREIYSSLLHYDGVQNLTASVSVAGTASTLTGRVMWKGVLVENTPIETP